MATFRFRAAVALDLRHAAETDALRARSHAEARFHEAYRASLDSQARRESAQQAAVELQRRGSDVDTLLWHRNWIVRLAAIVDDRRRDLEERAREVRAADVAWRKARQNRMALERMRDRAFSRFQQHERRLEMKVMDELARIRYAMPDNARSES